MYFGIFLISAATLLFEISLTRIFSVLFFHHFAFLVISTALFGFGFSGVLLFFFQHKIRNLKNTLSAMALLFAVAILLCYQIILWMPSHFKDVAENPTHILRLVLYYAILIVPFFFSGLVIGCILSSFPEKSGRLYCFDLIGGGLGCISVLWIIPALGGSSAIVASSFLAACASIAFRPSWVLRVVAVLIAGATLYLIPAGGKIFSTPYVTYLFRKTWQLFQGSNA